ncbi:hypothetical protein [Poritiphilus flavus]|uniref:Uncharacterized protein n=1 Tax=Poritiphilus flavus TaxID=2697053 RepID=A0A6L9E7M1_9FLAO|nr:hypothetical protein [Poritiphilus flavus]NAS10602.1 hypothetical protein [Poritiphilus flavus]
MGKDKRKDKSREKRFDLFKSLLIALASGFSVVLFQQLFFKDNLDYRFQKELLKENYEYYIAIQHLADFRQITQFSYRFEIFLDEDSLERIRQYSPNTDKITLKYRPPVIPAEFRYVKIPDLAVDSQRQKEWLRNKNFIIANKNKIDQDIYLEFQQIIKIVDENPWPPKPVYLSLFKDYDSIPELPRIGFEDRNIWTDSVFMETWFEKNRILWEKANEYVRIK